MYPILTKGGDVGNANTEGDDYQVIPGGYQVKAVGNQKQPNDYQESKKKFQT